MTRRFVSAKRLVRYFSNSSKLVEHRAQSPVREIKMLAVWPSFAEGFPTACSRIIYNKKLSNTCEEFKFRCWYDAGNERQKYAKRNRIGAGNPGKLVFVVSTTRELAQFISLFTKERLSLDRPNLISTQVFPF